MSKQVTRQSSKRGQSTNKQTSRPSSKQVTAPSKSAPRQTVQATAPSKSASRQSVRQERKLEEQLRREEEKRRSTRSRNITIVSALVAFVLAFGILGYFLYSANASTQTHTIVNSSYPPVDGIYCDQLEQTQFHYHALLSIYINGKLSPLAQGTGIAPDGSCYYWLHTHDSSGVVHIESPNNHTYTVGNFLDIWSLEFQRLGYPTQLDLATGWQVWIDGKPYNGDFHNIVLKPHEIITLAYNSPGVKPITTYAWNGL